MKPITVLLADDYLPVRDAFRCLLGRHADIVVVAEAASGHEAVQEALRVAPDVVLMDLSMPRIDGMEAMDGLEATRRIVRAAPRTAILIVSGEQAFAPYHALAAGARGYLFKPVAAAQLPEAIRAVAAGKTYFKE
jgi:DNA-binding NarL/FixJ family response regulator